MRKRRTTSAHALHEKAISEFHNLLAADETLSPFVFEKLRSAMRNNRPLYGERPIGVALRPHLLREKQFQVLTHAAQQIATASEKVAAAVVQNIDLDELGLTEAERRMALVDPGFSTAGVTTRLGAFVRADEIKFVESNAENPSSLPDQEELNRLLFVRPKLSRNSRIHTSNKYWSIWLPRDSASVYWLISVAMRWNGNGWFYSHEREEQTPIRSITTKALQKPR